LTEERPGTVYLFDAKTAEDFGLIDRALQGVQKFFGAFHRGTRIRKDQQTFIQEPMVRGVVERVTARHASLFRPDQLPMLPEGLYGVGPVWLEVLPGTASDERFSIQVRTPAEHKELDELRRRLAVIGDAWRRFPMALTEAARDLARVLERPAGLQSLSFRAGQPPSSTRRWVCLPVEYTSFCYAEGEHGRESRPLEPDEQALWHDGLRRVVSAQADAEAIEPVIPRYAKHPFVALRTYGDPTGMARAFDDRYFMASTELNLLNTVLFVDRAS
jgi:hypothetical protein